MFAKDATVIGRVRVKICGITTLADALVAMREELPGSVMLIFQPSEEGAPTGAEGGAALMLKEGQVRDFKPKAVFGTHGFPSLPAGPNGVAPGAESQPSCGGDTG